MNETEATKRLENLRAERRKMRNRLREIDGDLESVDVEDSEAAVATIKELTTEQETIQRVITELDAKIKRASDALEAVREAANKERLRALQDDYHEAAEVVADKLGELAQAMGEAEDVHAAIRQLTRYQSRPYHPKLRNWIKLAQRYASKKSGQYGRWDLSPQKRAEKQALANARQQIERALQRIKWAREGQDRVALEAAKEDLTWAKDAYKHHGGDPAEVIPSAADNVAGGARQMFENLPGGVRQALGQAS